MTSCRRVKQEAIRQGGTPTSDEVRQHLLNCTGCKRFVTALDAGCQLLHTLKAEYQSPRELVPFGRVAASRLRPAMSPRFAAAGLILACTVLMIYRFSRVESTETTPILFPATGQQVGAAPASSGEPVTGVKLRVRIAIDRPSHKRVPATVGSAAVAGTIVDDLEDINRPAAVQYDAEPLSSSNSAWVSTTNDPYVVVARPLLASPEPNADTAAYQALQREKAVVDPRLDHSVGLSAKGISFSELCIALSKQTGVEFVPSRSVADDKITLFCTKRPVRDLMRAVTEVFEFRWLRTGSEGAYRYEVVQDLRSQLREQQMRNQDKDKALLALNEQMERYRKFADLSPDELKEAAETASPEDKELLKKLADGGWGPTQLYFGLGGAELASLRDGKTLKFGPGAEDGPDTVRSQMPAGMSAGVLQNQSGTRVDATGGGFRVGPAKSVPNGVPPSQFSGAQGTAMLALKQNELGQVSLIGGSGFEVSDGANAAAIMSASDLAVGSNPETTSPRNARANAARAGDPRLRKLVNLTVSASCKLEADEEDGREDARPHAPNSADAQLEVRRQRRDEPGPLASQVGDRATTADVLEAIHIATGEDVIGDHFTRLYDPAEISSKGQTLFAAICKAADRSRMRWTHKQNWHSFRTLSFYNERPKEVPNRLLDRWRSAKKEHGTLRLDDLCEIANLSDAQLQASGVAEGARAQYGLREWRWVTGGLVGCFRLVGALPPPLRRAVASEQGASVGRLNLPAQQVFATEAFGGPANAPPIQLLVQGRLLFSMAAPDPERPTKIVPVFRMLVPDEDGGMFETELGPNSSRRGKQRSKS